MKFLKLVYSNELNGYDGDNIHYILDRLNRFQTGPRPFARNISANDSLLNADKLRNILNPHEPDSSTVIGYEPFNEITLQNVSNVIGYQSTDEISRGPIDSMKVGVATVAETTDIQSGSDIQIEIDNVIESVHLDILPGKEVAFNDDRYSFHRTLKARDLTVQPEVPTEDRKIGRTEVSQQAFGEHSDEQQINNEDINNNKIDKNQGILSVDFVNSTDKYYRTNSYAEFLLKIAHILHYVGIGILAFFVVQVRVRPNPTTPDQIGLNQNKRDQTRLNRTKPDQTGPNQTKPYQTGPNQTKPERSQTKLTNPKHSKQDTKPDQTRPNQSVDQTLVLFSNLHVL